MRGVKVRRDITNGTSLFLLNVRLGFLVLFQAQGRRADEAEVVEKRVDADPHINVTVNRIDVFQETLGHRERENIGMKENGGTDAEDTGFSCLVGNAGGIVP